MKPMDNRKPLGVLVPVSSCLINVLHVLLESAQHVVRIRNVYASPGPLITKAGRSVHFFVIGRLTSTSMTCLHLLELLMDYDNVTIFIGHYMCSADKNVIRIHHW